jgi:hypothetical protein
MAKRRSRLREHGNPLQLTNRQHVFPVASIKRFTNSDGVVSVRHFTSGKTFPAIPTDDVFCAMCAWDYRAESGFMLAIENRFQTVAAQIEVNPSIVLTPDQHQAITEFWALWVLRAQFRSQPEGDRVFNGIAGENLNNQQRDVVESQSGTFVLGSTGAMPGRFVAGALIQKGIDEHTYNLRGQVWGVIRADEGEFIVPDEPKQFTAVPLAPMLLLCLNHDSCVISKSEVAKANTTFRQVSKRYYFARDISACPGDL